MPPTLNVLLGGFLQLLLLINVLSTLIVMPSASLVAALGAHTGNLRAFGLGFTVAFAQAMSLLLPAMHMHAHR